ncbi:ParA family protein [Vibrio cholerae]|uniref:ParA family protein n=1 Tax=Vibrio cholerae TaxID=666 RepID=UPI002934D04C|nr:ParA family protein [Vibrio cholerae]MDV2387306.1 ParA family protein [Vibrio cholerae]
MMKVLSVLNGKGGVGKTTTSINVAACLSRMGFKVVVVDTDPQSSVANWVNDNCLFDVATCPDEKQIYQVKKTLAGYDYILIDGAGSISAISAAAVMVSDMVIVPITPSPLDFSASVAILDVVEARSQLKPVPVRFLMTKVIAGTEMFNVLRESIGGTGVEAMKIHLKQRQAYVKTLTDGGTIFDSNDGQAKGEIELLSKEIINVLAGVK